MDNNYTPEKVKKIMICSDEDLDICIPDASEELKDICCKKAYEIYGNPLPETVSDRLDNELFVITEKNDFSWKYMLAHRIAEKLRDMEVYTWARGAQGNSLVTNLLGITKTNPLPSHYICPHCRHVEFISENENVDSGFDLVSVYQSKRLCPICNHIMKGDGHNLYFELFAGNMHDKEPHFSFDVPIEAINELSGYIYEMLGDKGSSLVRKIVIGEDEPEDSSYKESVVDIIYSSDLSVFRELRLRTGIDARDIPIDGIPYHRVFADETYKSIPQLTKIYKKNPQLTDEDVQKLVNDMNICCFSDLVKLLGHIHSMGMKKTYAHRDDIMQAMIKRDKSIYEGCESVKDYMRKEGYLFPKAHDTEYAIMIFHLLWYRVHFPEEFKIVVNVDK